MDFQKRSPVLRIDSMYQAAIFCRGWAKHEYSESLQVDWKRGTTLHKNLIPRNCEVSCWIVSWFSLIFWIDISSTFWTCALFIFSNSCILRICVSRRAFSFRNNSSCNRACSRRDVRLVMPCIMPPFFFCKSLMHLLSDSTWTSLLARSVLARFNKWSL